jgi:hypothetical protein
LCIRNNSLCLESNTYKNAFAKKGLESMKLTYKDDANICCKIDRIIVNVSNHIEIMKNLIK